MQSIRVFVHNNILYFTQLFNMVELIGFEPMTLCMQNRRSTNWAITPKLVGLRGLEPLTSPLSGVRSNQLSYRPKKYVLWKILFLLRR